MKRRDSAPPLAGAPRLRSLPRLLVDPDRIRNDTIALDGPEAKHARVRRLARGERVVLFDGHGRSWVGNVTAWSSHGPTVTIEQPLPERDGESPLDLTLAIALLKAEKLDWAIEKATELGVARIRPFACARSLARPSPARVARWGQIALSAAKQCGRSLVPPVDDPIDFRAVLADPAPCRLVFWEDAEPSESPVPVIAAPAQVAVLVGPEGGFTPDEVEAARTAGYRACSLGPRIVRAETAAVAAVALCQQWWGDLAPARS